MMTQWALKQQTWWFDGIYATIADISDMFVGILGNMACFVGWYQAAFR